MILCIAFESSVKKTLLEPRNIVLLYMCVLPKRQILDWAENTFGAKTL